MQIVPQAQETILTMRKRSIHAVLVEEKKMKSQNAQVRLEKAEDRTARRKNKCV